MAYVNKQQGQQRPQGRPQGRPQSRPQSQQGGQQQRRGFSTDADYGGDFGPLSPGEHIVWITAATLRTSAKGNDVISCRLEVIGADDDKGRLIFEHATLTQDLGLARLQGICLGIDPAMKGVDDDPENGINPWSQESVHANVLGGILVATVEHVEETFKGRLQTRNQLVLDGYRTCDEAEWGAIEKEYQNESGNLNLELPGDAYTWKSGASTNGAPPNDGGKSSVDGYDDGSYY